MCIYFLVSLWAIKPHRMIYAKCKPEMCKIRRPILFRIGNATIEKY